MLFKRVPVFNWLPKYSMDDAIGDLIAGITVGLTVIPQALAYSGIAGLDAQVRYNFLIYLLLSSIMSTNFYFNYSFSMDYMAHF